MAYRGPDVGPPVGVPGSEKENRSPNKERVAESPALDPELEASRQAELAKAKETEAVAVTEGIEQAHNDIGHHPENQTEGGEKNLETLKAELAEKKAELERITQGKNPEEQARAEGLGDEIEDLEEMIERQEGKPEAVEAATANENDQKPKEEKKGLFARLFGR